MLLQTIILVIISSCSPPTVTGSVSGEVDGAKIYKNYCKSCHGPKGDRGLSNAADLSKSALKEDEIRKIILFGTDNGMSAYKSVITEEEEIVALIDHVKKLQQ
jgi:mono/diheme cytochrome c family protein